METLGYIIVGLLIAVGAGFFALFGWMRQGFEILSRQIDHLHSRQSSDFRDLLMRLDQTELLAKSISKNLDRYRDEHKEIALENGKRIDAMNTLPERVETISQMIYALGNRIHETETLPAQVEAVSQKIDLLSKQTEIIVGEPKKKDEPEGWNPQKEASYQQNLIRCARLSIPVPSRASYALQTQKWGS